MFLFKLLFTLVFLGIIGVLGVVLYVHSKFENIVLNMSQGDKLTTLDGSVVQIDSVCRVLMNVYYFDEEHNYHEVTWGEFMAMVGTYNLATKYSKSYNKIDKLIMGY